MKLRIWSWLVLGLVVIACQETADEDEGSTEEAPSQPGSLVLEVDNELVDAFPQGLAVDSLSSTEDSSATATAGTIQVADVGTSLHLAPSPKPLQEAPSNETPQNEMCKETPDAGTDPLFSGLQDLGATDFRKPPREKFELYEKILAGTEDQCVSPATLQAIKVIFFTSRNEDLDSGSGCYKPDWGILARDHESGDVCMVGTARQQIDEVSAYVDMVNGIVAAMLCQGKKDGKIEGVMAQETSIEFTQSLQGAADAAADSSVGDMVISYAGVARLADDAETSRPVYRSDVELKIKGKDFEIHLVNSPVESGDILGSGTIWLSHEHVSNKKDTNEQDVKTKAISITYDKDYDQTNSEQLRLNFEMRLGLFHTDFDVFGEDGVVNYNVGADFTGDKDSATYGNYSDSTEPSAANDYAERMAYVVYDGYPEIGVGRMAYWVNFGGKYGETARGFVFETEIVEGRFQGCGLAGSTTSQLANGVSIRKSIYEELDIEPRGYTRPLACSDKAGTKVWEQCFYRDRQGDFLVDTNKTKSSTGIDFIELGDTRVTRPQRRPTGEEAEYRPPLGDAGTKLPPPEK